jgi:4-hydroxy-3-methylbut-2-enyl diphosphate reductase
MNQSSSQKQKEPLHVEIDTHSGFCFGVVRAIQKAEEALSQGETLCSLGDIVHNGLEVERLSKKGMKTVDHPTLNKLKEETVLFRAHGEPPESYETTKRLGLRLIDATCPVVLKLQERIKKAWLEMNPINGQVVIFGKKGHAEVKGLSGQTHHQAIVIESIEQIGLIDSSRPVVLFSQTTKNPEEFLKIAQTIKERATEGVEVRIHNTICRQVSGRVPHLQEFARQHEMVIFVGGVKSSNARVLFETCKTANPNTYFVSGPDDLNPQWFGERPASTGICGATSTPVWLMEAVATKIKMY